jgi:hypothetical protein
MEMDDQTAASAGAEGQPRGQARGQPGEGNKSTHIKTFQNAVKKECIIHKIQVLQEEKDSVPESGEALQRASAGVADMRQRFGRALAVGKAVEDPLDMVPAEEFAEIEAELAASVASGGHQTASQAVHALHHSPRRLPAASASGDHGGARAAAPAAAGRADRAGSGAS